MPFSFRALCGQHKGDRGSASGVGKSRPSVQLVDNTELINYSVEKRIKPRLEVLDALQERGLSLSPKKLSLSSVLIAMNERFLEKYVGPNSDTLGDDWVVSVVKKLGAKSPSLIKR